MNILSSLLFLMPNVAFRRAATKHLATSALGVDGTHVWQKITSLQVELRKTRPRYSFGVNLFLQYMEWDVAFYRVLLEQGTSQEQACHLIEEINWVIFGAGTKASFLLSRLRSANHQTRIQWVLDLMFFVLFTKPFRKQAVPADSDIAFNVTACPIAVYFQQQGVPELTRYAACNLDHRMARDWGIKLERTRTIAEGGSYCDFRFKFPPSESTRAK